jgi:hypothetical protein
MPDEDDRPRDASSAADDAWADIVIPDDISTLTDDIEAYRREQRRAQRQARIQRWMDHRGALPLAIVAFAVVIAGLIAMLLTVLAPKALAPTPKALPLAAPAAAPGAKGGLLPEVTLRGPAGPVDSRDLRPAVLVLVPPGCDCTPLLTVLAGQANSVPLPLSVVIPVAAARDPAKLPPALGGITVNSYYDPNRVFATTFRAEGIVTAVLVGKDGLVTERLPVTKQTIPELGPPLQRLLLPTLAQG